MKQEVTKPSVWSGRITKYVIAVAIMCVGIAASVLPLAIATGTFRTQNLIVDQTISVGLAGGQQTWQPAGTTAPSLTQSISIGLGALAANVDGADDMAYGPGALAHTIGTDPLAGPNNGVDLVGIGLNALNANTIGEQEIAIGGHSLESTTNNRNNIGLGLNTLKANLADNNFAAGTNAMIANITGTHDLVISVAGLLACTNCSDNIVLGDGGMISAPNGSNDNISIGFDALQNGGIQNVGIGTFSLRVATGFNNTATGVASGPNVSSGDSNTFDGAQTGAGITTGRADTVIGANVTGLAAGLSNNIILADGDGVVRLQCDSTGAWDVKTHLVHNVVDPVAAQDAATKAYVDAKASVIQSSVYYADGSDGTCNFDGVTTPVCGASLVGTVYTLTRDIAPMNMTVAAATTVREDNFRIMIFNTLTGGGAGATISNSGFPAGAAGDPRIPGNCGGTNSHYYQACATTGGAGNNGGGAGNNGGANAGAIPQWPAQASSATNANGAGHGQGGGGGTAGANAGGTGGSIANPSVNVGYFDGVGAFSGRYDSYGNQWALYGTGGGGGGCTGGACTGGGGGGGGGITFVSANQCTGTIVIAAAGGAGGAGVLAGGTSAGGGGGGGGGIVTYIYSHRAAGCTTSVAGGTHGNGAGTGVNGGDGSSGSAQLYNLSGDGS